MVWNTDLCETLELENLLTNAAVTMHSAEARKVSLPSLHLRALHFLISCQPTLCVCFARSRKVNASLTACEPRCEQGMHLT